MSWQDTPLIDSTPKDVDEELESILVGYEYDGEFSTEEAIRAIKKLFKVDGGS